MNKLKLIAFTCLVLSTASSSAFAQEPDPFAAYEGGAAAPAPVAPAPVAPPPAPAPLPPQSIEQQQVEAVQKATNAPDGKEIITNQGAKDSALVVEEVVPIDRLYGRNRFSLNAATALSYDGNYDQVLGGEHASSTSLNILLTLGIGFTVWDNVTVELSGGTLWRRNAKSRLEFGTEHDWLFLARGWYSFPVGTRTALLGGLGLGGYFGSSKVNSLPTTSGASKTDPVLLDTTSAGFIGKVNGGIAYVLGDSWQFRILADFTWMIGKEHVTNQSAALDDNATHVGLELGLTYTF